MKKITLVVAMLLSGITLIAQKINPSAVPRAVKENLTGKFPEVKEATWELENGNYEAKFIQKGKVVTVVFAPIGTWEETEVEIQASQLPQTVLKYISSKYKRSQIKEASMKTKADGEVHYEAEVNGKDLIFDIKGNFLREEKDSDDKNDKED